MSKTNIENLCTYIKSSKAKRYPVENRRLAEATDFIVNGYLKMLAVVLQQSQEITEPQLFLFERILAGTNSDKSAEDYLRMALSIEIVDFVNVSSELKELDVKYRFIFDAIMLSCIDGKQEEQLELVAELSESLKIEKEELQYLATMAKCMLRVNASDYVDADERRVESIPDDIFDGYIRLLSKSCIMQSSNTTIFQPTCTEDVDIYKLNQITEVTTPVLKLHAVKVDLKGFPLLFKDYKKVVFDGCEFVNGDLNGEKGEYNAVITFENCDKIIIRNSVFHDFKCRPIKILSANTTMFINTNFENCFHEYSDYAGSWMKLGGVIRIENKQSNDPVIIDRCIFEKCGGRNQIGYYSTQFICNSQTQVNNTSFRDCWHYIGAGTSYEKTDPKDSQRTMFAPGSKALNCTFENCADFCQ